MGLVNLTKVKDQLEIKEIEFDIILQDYIDEISDSAEDYMDLKFAKIVGQVEYHDGGKKRLNLKYANALSVRIWSDPDRVFTDDKELDSDDFEVYPERGIIKAKGFIFHSGYCSIKVQYDGGYEVVDVPKALRRALTKQVVYVFRRRKDPGLSSVTFPDGSINKFSNDEWLEDVRNVLDRFGRITL